MLYDTEFTKMLEKNIAVLNKNIHKFKKDAFIYERYQNSLTYLL